MFSLFKRRKNGTGEEQTPQELYEGYVRLVSYGKADEFLDFDTTFLIEQRESLEELIAENAYSPLELEGIQKTDELFKSRAKASASYYAKQIESGAQNADYLVAVLRGLAYPRATDKKKWWYHLLD